MFDLFNLQSAVGLYRYSRWVQDYVHRLYPHLASQARTPEALLTICECGCAERSQSAADAHGVTPDELEQARECFFSIAAQELLALQYPH